ncbi:MAG: type III-B CRISPR module RAMP protein Cmr4 [Ardenticatenia bacterium]|nr:type III-B CRISPR module RAMP protein Cmr4 [Ardenticatenia bacterium]
MATYRRQRYLLMASDPVHIGTGGYRLGRVDLSIVREPGTRVPKIPGTSLSGAVRAYAASQYGSLTCAGQKNHCGESTCPICYTFGYLRGEGERTTAFSGVANLFDAHVVLFPVHSMAGPVWVSTPQRLKEAGFSLPEKVPDIPTGAGLYTWQREDALNLGWLMLEAGPEVAVQAPEAWRHEERWQAVQGHIVLVQDSLFSQVVNSNLEVRTSVSIDPERGAAEEGALFTYEALPRATFLVGEVVLDDYRDGQEDRPFPVEKTKDDKALPGGPWNDPLDVVQAGLRMAAWLGVGGMGTRGFGRIAIVGKPLEQGWGEEEWK